MVEMIAMAADVKEYGVLPRGGGMDDQIAADVDAIRIVRGTWAVMESKLIDARRAAAKAGARRG